MGPMHDPSGRRGTVKHQVCCVNSGSIPHLQLLSRLVLEPELQSLLQLCIVCLTYPENW